MLAEPGSGQDSDGEAAAPAGLRFELAYQSRFEADTNRRLRPDPDGVSFQTTHSFDLALLSDTRNQTFALRFGTDARLGDDAAGDWDFIADEPTYSLAYTRESANSALTLNGSFRRRQIEFLEPFFLDDDGNTIVDEAGISRSDGFLDEVTLGTTLEVGREAPLGNITSFSYRSRTYTENEDPSLFDSEDFRLTNRTELRFSEVSTAHLTGRARYYTYEGGREVDGREYALSAGLSREFSETLSMDVSAGVTFTDRDETIDGDVISEEGTGLNTAISISKEVPRGSIFGEFRRNAVDGDFRSTLSFGRTLEMASYSLSGRVGLTAREDGDPESVFEIGYERPLASGSFNAALQRGVTLNTVDEENLLTSVRVGYSRSITEVSSVSLNMNVTQIDVATFDDDTGEERTEAALNAAYTRSLTEDWDMTLGYRGRFSRVEEDAVSNAVFLTIGRDFLFRP